jgi:ABC-2 type transport system permease protein
MSTLTQTGLVLSRELRPVVRDPFSIIFGLIQPIFFLALFAPLLIATTGLPTGDALQWFVPGVLVMIALFGTSATGANLQMEMTTGSHERVLVTPLSRSAVMIGKALKEIVPTVVQGVIIVAVAVPFGFDLHPVGAVIGLAMLALFCVGVGALSSTLALAVKNQEWMFWVVQQTLLFPLLLLAGMLLPIDEAAPGWLTFLSNLNPLRYLVDAERSLFAGEVLTADVGYGALAAVIVAVGGLVIGARAMARSN